MSRIICARSKYNKQFIVMCVPTAIIYCCIMCDKTICNLKLKWSGCSRSIPTTTIKWNILLTVPNATFHNKQTASFAEDNNNGVAFDDFNHFTHNTVDECPANDPTIFDARCSVCNYIIRIIYDIILNTEILLLYKILFGTTGQSQMKTEY